MIVLENGYVMNVKIDTTVDSLKRKLSCIKARVYSDNDVKTILDFVKPYCTLQHKQKSKIYSDMLSAYKRYYK